MTKKLHRESLIVAVILLILLGACIYLDSILPSYHIVIKVIKKAAVYSLVAVSMNLLNGFTGLFSLGQAGFMLLGAYAYAVLCIPVAKRAGVYQQFEGGLIQFSLPETFANLFGEGAGTVVGILIALLIGGLIAALVMVYQGNNLPTPVLFAAMTIGSMAAGALWGFVPAWFKSRWGTNETLFTLMMNYVATSIVACMTNIMRGQASSLGTLNKATKAGWFPIIMGQRYTINIIVVIVLTFAMYAYLKFSKQGYEISVVGESENTARYAGINVRRVTVRTMLISGAVCGLCGFLIVAGKDQTIATTSAGGRGFTAIIVAWLAKFNTFYMALISFLLVFLERGASEIASAYSLNEYAADIITGIILFFILGSEFFINYRLILRGAHKEGK